MSKAALHARRIREWVRYPAIQGSCRISRCTDRRVAETPEGQYCLAHYMELPSCSICGAAADQYASTSPICAGCQDKDIEMVLVRSSLSMHDETPGHDAVCQVSGDFRRGLTKKMREEGFKDLSSWGQSRRRRKRSA